MIQNLLGKYLIRVFPESGHCQQHQLPELEGWQILGAKYERGVLVVMAEQSGKYHKWLYRMRGTNIDSVLIGLNFCDVNFCVTDRGTVVVMDHNGDLRISMNSVGHKAVLTKSCGLSDATLYSDGHQVLAAVGKTLYKLSMS